MRDVGSPENVPAMIERVKRGEAKLYGYGHRTYRTEDPRIKGTKKILRALKAQTPVLDIAGEVVRVAGEDEYFLKRGLHANADLYGVFIYIALYVCFSPPSSCPPFTGPTNRLRYLSVDLLTCSMPQRVRARNGAGHDVLHAHVGLDGALARGDGSVRPRISS